MSIALLTSWTVGAGAIIVALVQSVRLERALRARDNAKRLEDLAVQRGNDLGAELRVTEGVLGSRDALVATLERQRDGYRAQLDAAAKKHPDLIADRLDEIGGR